MNNKTTNGGTTAIASRADFPTIARWIKPDARVLDLGCGDGALLRYLIDSRGSRGYGVDIEDANVLACVRSGVSVVQRDLEGGLADFGSDSFDYVVLSQTLQVIRNTESLLREMLRLAPEGIVSLPNFGYWRHRLAVLGGHMPVSPALPYQWYDTPNVHLCTIADFEALCASSGARVVERIVLDGKRVVSRWPNLFGSLAIYRFERA